MAIVEVPSCSPVSRQRRGGGLGLRRRRNAPPRAAERFLRALAALWPLVALAGGACVPAGVAAQEAAASGDAAALRQFFVDTGGAAAGAPRGWADGLGWQADGGDPCLDGWGGVTCDGGRVTRVELADNRVNGPLDALGALDGLQYLRVEQGGLSGGLGAVAGLTQLTHLYLESNRLNGTLDALASLSSLQHLDLSFNDFSGTMDAVAGLTDLVTMQLGNNRLSGSLAAVAPLTNLQHLNLNNNQLNGTIDAVAPLTELRQLYLYRNQLSGGITALESLVNLEILHVYDNQLSGGIDAVGSLVGLLHLGISSNQFSGDFGALANLGQLTQLILINSGLSGDITVLQGLRHLTYIDAREMEVTGTLDVAAWQALTHLRIGGTALSALTGHRPFPATLVKLDIATEHITSLPEAAFSLCHSSVDLVNLGTAFPDPCPAGQSNHTAPVSGAHYCERNQSLGLQAIYEETQGESWTQADGWAEAASVGLWDPCAGGAVVGASAWTGVSCGDGDALGRVVKLELGGLGLTGAFPGPALASVSSLADVDLNTNPLSGGLDGIEPLAELHTLRLYDCDISGGLDAVAPLRSLHTLALSTNALSGGLQPVAGLTALTALHLDNNDFSRTLDALAGLRSLTSLRLDNNELTGTIDALGELDDLEYLWLAQNGLYGGIDALAGLDELVELRAADNSLNGTLQPLVGHAKLETLSANHNAFTGELDALVGCTALTHIALYGNQLNGTLDVLSGMADLDYLAVHGNQLTGTLEPVLGLNKLTVVFVHNNRLHGDAAGLESLHEASYIDIGDNDFTGSIDLASFPNLRTFRAPHTQLDALTGHHPFPAGLFHLRIDSTPIASLPEGAFTLCAPTLTDVDVDGVVFPNPCPAGQLAGTTPLSGAHYCERNQSLGLQAIYEETQGESWTQADGWAEAASVGLWDPCAGGAVVGASAWAGVSCGDGDWLGRVTELRLPGNALSGDFPGAALASLSSLVAVDLHNNALSGAVDGISSLSRLQQLVLEGNQLSGGIAPVAALVQLESLNLARNEFTGTIDAVAGLTGLTSLRLDDNELSGSLDPVASLTALQKLRLFRNRLSGDLGALAGLRSLQLVEIYVNQFTGGLEPLANLELLRFLSLSGNKLNGTLDAVAGLTNLDNLHVSHNDLHGSIDAVAGLTKMTNLGLASNGFTGGIDALSHLTNLLLVSVASNQLVGSLLPLQGLPLLYLLDLSGNQLSGDIDVLGSLVALRQVYVHNNALSGTLHALTQLEALEEAHLDRNAFSGHVPAAFLEGSGVVSFRSNDNDLSAVGLNATAFVEWCASIAQCQFDAPQAPAGATQLDALAAVRAWLPNATSTRWAEGEDPCEAPWDGVACDWRGAVRHVDVDDVGDDSLSFPSGTALPGAALALGGARQLDFVTLDASDDVVWPDEALVALSAPSGTVRSTSAALTLATAGAAGSRVVDAASVWLTWRHSNSTDPDATSAGASVPALVALDATSGTGSIQLDATNASAWPQHADVDAIVEARAALLSDEPGFTATPPLPTDKLLRAWRVDRLPPRATLAVPPPRAVATHHVDVTFGCSEPGCRYQYSTDGGGSWLAVATQSDDDGVGGANVTQEAAPAFAAKTRFETAPPRVSPESSATFVMEQGADVGGYLYSLDGGPWRPAERTIVVDELPAGWRGIVVRAAQAGTGLLDAEPAAYAWRVQPAHAPPPAMTLAIRSGPPQVTPLATAAFALESNHAEALLEYRLDGGPWRGTLPSLTLGPLSPGAHVLEVRGTSMQRGREGLLNGYVHAADWAWVYEPAASGLRVAVEGDGDYSIRVRATDPSDNLGPASAPFPFRSDTVAPSTAAAVASDQFSAWPSSASGASGPAPAATLDVYVPRNDQLNVTVRLADGQPATDACVDCAVVCTLLPGGDAPPAPCGETDAAAADGVVNVTVELSDASAAEGRVSLSFAARDEAGNVDPSPALLHALFDTSPPETTALSVANAVRHVDGVALVNDTAVQLDVACEDAAGVGCAFTVDVEPLDAGASPAQVTHTSRAPSRPEAATVWVEATDGDYTAQGSAWDAVGRRDATPLLARLRVDTSPPTAGVAVLNPRLAQASAAQEPSNATDALLRATGGDETELLVGFHVCVDALLAANHTAEGSTAPVHWSDEALLAPRCASPPPSGAYGTLPPPWVEPDALGRDDGLGLAAMMGARGLASGLWRVSAWAVDAAGNAAQQPASVVLSVDTRPPVLALSPQNPSNALITRERRVVVAVNATERGCSFTAYMDGQLVVTTTNDEVLAIQLHEDADDGVHEASVWAVDVAGNVAPEPASYRWWLDTTAPAVDMSAVAAALRGGDALSAAQASNATAPLVRAACVEGDASAAAPGAACQLTYALYADGEFATAPVFTAMVASGSFAALPLTHDGPYSVRVGARDVAGNEDPATVGEVSWVKDTVAPSLGPVTLQRYVKSTAVSVPLTCEDRSLCTLHVRVRGRQVGGGCAGDAGALQDDADGAAAEVTEWAALEPHAWELRDSPGSASPLDGRDVLRFFAQAELSGLGDGEQRVEVRATDGAGQGSAVATATFTVDTAPPAAPVIDAAPAALTSNKAFTWEVRVPGEAMAPAGPDATVLQYELTTPSEVHDWQSVEVLGDEPGADLSLVKFTYEAAQEGRHVLSFRARDAAGNIGAVTVREWVVTTSEPSTGVLAQPAAISGVDYARFVFNASLPAGAAGAAAANATDNLWVEVRLGTGGWADLPCAAAAPGAGGHVTCTYTLQRLELGPYVLSARARDAAGNVDGAPQQVSWSVALCGEGQFEEIGADGALTCAECPEGAWCGDAGAPNVTFAAVGALPGWWTSRGGDGRAYYKCRIAGACLGGDGNGTRSACATGHTSRLCSLCEEDYFMRWDGCQPCPATKASSWAFLVGVAAALLCGAITVFKLRALLPMAMIKVMAAGLQILASASAVYSVPWPEQVAQLLDSLRVSLLEVMTLLRVSCTSPMTFYSSLTLTLVVFKGIAVAVVFAVAWSSVRQRRAAEARRSSRLAAQATRNGARRRSSVAAALGDVGEAAREVRFGLDWWRVFKLLAMYLLLAYPGVSMKLLRMFNCVALDGDSWLVADMRLRCYDAAWGGFAFWAAAMLVVYTIGLPVFIAVVLWRHRHELHRPDVVHRLGFLYEGHGTHAYFGEPLELLRKLLLSSLPLFFTPGSPMQLLYALVVSFGAAVLHAALKPFKSMRRAYWLQHASLAATFSLFAMGLVYQMDGLDRSSVAFAALSYLLLVVQAGFVVAGLALVLHATAANLLHELRRRNVARAITTAAGTFKGAAAFRRARARAEAAAAAPNGSVQRPRMVDNPMRSARAMGVEMAPLKAADR